MRLVRSWRRVTLRNPNLRECLRPAPHRRDGPPRRGVHHEVTLSRSRSLQPHRRSPRGLL